MDTAQPLVSVVIATYNMGYFLPQAIESVLAQTYTHFSLHIIDDGSSDDTADVVKGFSQDPRVHYCRQLNQGQAKAKNRGILESSGEYVALLDADDLWVSTKLEKQVPILRANPAIGVVYTDCVHIDGDGRPLQSPKRTYHSGKVAGRLLVDNFVNLGTCLVRRKCFERLGAFDESYAMAIDYDLWLRISTEYEFYFLNEKLLRYRMWPGQMSHNYRKRWECAINIMRSFLERFPNAVDKRTISEAWAHTFTERGHTWARADHDNWGAFRDYLLALRYRPTYLPAFKGIAKLLLNRPT
jgi:glycosyltransferase involved in cell wall biosynthesis